MADRVDRFTAGFFERLDSLFPPERLPDRGPSVCHGLPLVRAAAHRDQLATDFEGTTLPADEPPVRVWVGSGVLVGNLAVYGYVAEDEQSRWSGS